MTKLLKPELHPCQIKILITLSNISQGSFAQLNVDDLPTDWFSFHIKQVVKNGWVEKSSTGNYVLTSEGKKFSLQFNPSTVDSDFSQRLSVLLVVRKDNKFLVQQRKSEPFRDFWEFPTHRIPFGESPATVAVDFLKAETGLEGTLSFVGMLHKVEKKEREYIFDDKYYFVYQMEDASGDLKQEFSQGLNYWLTEKEFKNKELLHFDLSSTFNLLNSKKIGLEEVTGVIEHY